MRSTRWSETPENEVRLLAGALHRMIRRGGDHALLGLRRSVSRGDGAHSQSAHAPVRRLRTVVARLAQAPPESALGRREVLRARRDVDSAARVAQRKSAGPTCRIRRFDSSLAHNGVVVITGARCARIAEARVRFPPTPPRRHRQTVKTPRRYRGNLGSIPSGGPIFVLVVKRIDHLRLRSGSSRFESWRGHHNRMLP